MKPTQRGLSNRNTLPFEDPGSSSGKQQIYQETEGYYHELFDYKNNQFYVSPHQDPQNYADDVGSIDHVCESISSDKPLQSWFPDV